MEQSELSLLETKYSKTFTNAAMISSNMESDRGDLSHWILLLFKSVVKKFPNSQNLNRPQGDVLSTYFLSRSKF